MNKMIVCFVLSAFVAIVAIGDDLSSNVYMKVASIFSGGDLSETNRLFAAVRGGGFDNELDSCQFNDLNSYVSNNCNQILSSWSLYRTNEVVRFSVLSAVGFSGVDVYTNTLSCLLASFESGCTSEWASIEFVASPYGTPLDGILARRISAPGFSNLVSRVKSASLLMSDADTSDWCDEVLSGAAKRELDDLDLIESLR